MLEVVSVRDFPPMFKHGHLLIEFVGRPRAGKVGIFVTRDDAEPMTPEAYELAQAMVVFNFVVI